MSRYQMISIISTCKWNWTSLFQRRHRNRT